MQHTALTGELTTTRPRVSIILATYNEAPFIAGCLASILSQHTTSHATGEFEIEVLAVDGMSDDGTRAILQNHASGDSRLRLIDNPRRKTPFAFNLGLRHASGEYVCIFGGHCIYRPDYIAVCLGELMARNAAGCGGRVITMPAAKTVGARLVAWTMSSPFGSSRKSFRTQCEGEVDSVNYPLLQRHLVLAAGGYDEELIRNQDNDMSQKLRARGHIFWCTWKTQCFYFTKGTVKQLFSYAFKNGFWNVLSFRKNPHSMGVRHFVPLAFVLCLLLSVIAAAFGILLRSPFDILAFLPIVLLLGLHLVVGTGAAAKISLRERSPAALLLPAIFLGFHIAYGFGSLAGVVNQAARAPAARQEPKGQSVPSQD
jgi:succinoglycan biosynthesis protein ExoA